MKMTRPALCAQIKRNNLAVHRISEYTAKLYARDMVLEKEEWKRKYIELEGEYKELKVNHASMATLMSVYTSAMSTLKKNMNSLIECFDEQSSPIIGEDVLVDSQGNIFNLPDLSATVQELLHKTSDNPKPQYKCQKMQEQKSSKAKDNSRKETTGNIKLDDDSVGSDDTTTCSPPSDKHDVPFLNNTKTGKEKTVENEEKSMDGSFTGRTYPYRSDVRSTCNRTVRAIIGLDQ